MIKVYEVEAGTILLKLDNLYDVVAFKKFVDTCDVDVEYSDCKTEKYEKDTKGWESYNRAPPTTTL